MEREGGRNSVQSYHRLLSSLVSGHDPINESIMVEKKRTKYIHLHYIVQLLVEHRSSMCGLAMYTKWLPPKMHDQYH